MLGIQLDNLPFSQSQLRRSPEEVIHLETVIVAGGDVDPQPGAGQFPFGNLNPLLDNFERFRNKELVNPLGILAEFRDFIGIGQVRIIAAAADAFFHLRQLVGTFQDKILLQKRNLVKPPALLNDWNNRLAGHVAAQDEHVCSVKFPRI